jgi:hypothetical protein
MTATIYPLVPLPEPWTPAQATERIRAMASADGFSLTLAGHAEDQMEERALWTPDVMYVLQNGFVYGPPEESTRKGFYKYTMVSPTPNSNRREVKIVVIPSISAPAAKVVTVMWRDEPMQRG